MSRLAEALWLPIRGGHPALEAEDQGDARISGRDGLMFDPDAMDVPAKHWREPKTDVRIGSHVLRRDHSILERRLGDELRYGRKGEVGRVRMPSNGRLNGIGLRMRRD